MRRFVRAAVAGAAAAALLATGTPAAAAGEGPQAKAGPCPSVYFYDGANRQGKIFCSLEDKNLSNNKFNNSSTTVNDKISSVYFKLPNGKSGAKRCWLNLYEHKNYKGRSTSLAGKNKYVLWNLKDLAVGNDRVSSIKAVCK